MEEEQWDNEFARSIKGEPRQPVPPINRDHVPAEISDRAGVHLEEDQADSRLGQQDEGIDPPEAREVSMPPDRLVAQVRSDTLKRMNVERGLGKKYGPTPGWPVPRLAVITKPVTRTHAGDRMRAELRRMKKEESILPKNKHPKFWRMGEEDVTMRQDVSRHK